VEEHDNLQYLLCAITVVSNSVWNNMTILLSHEFETAIVQQHAWKYKLREHNA